MIDLKSLLSGVAPVPVSIIPRLIAEEVHKASPRDTERRIIGLRKSWPQPKTSDGFPDIRRHESLTSEDWRELDRMWVHLPPFQKGMTAEQCAPYVDAFINDPWRPGWVLEPVWLEPGEANGYRLERDVREHAAAMVAAIRGGVLVARSRARIPLSPAATDAEIEAAYVSPGDLARYVEQFTGVGEVNAAPDTPQPWGSLTPEQKKAAWNAMDPEARRAKATELVKKHSGDKTAAGREVGITRNRIAQLLRETEGQAEAPLPVNKWTQAAGMTTTKRGKASR